MDDTVAEGFPKNMKNPVWIGTLYILSEVMPVLSKMSVTVDAHELNVVFLTLMVFSECSSYSQSTFFHDP